LINQCVELLDIGSEVERTQIGKGSYIEVEGPLDLRLMPEIDHDKTE
jgi:hypothetical protein